MSESHGVRVGGATSSAPASTSGRRCAAARVVDLEGDPQPRRHPAADLDLVDHGDLGRVGQLEGGPAGVEDHARARRSVAAPGRARPAGRARRGRRPSGLEVLGLDDQPELAHPRAPLPPPRRAWCRGRASGSRSPPSVASQWLMLPRARSLTWPSWMPTARSGADRAQEADRLVEAGSQDPWAGTSRVCTGLVRHVQARRPGGRKKFPPLRSGSRGWGSRVDPHGWRRVVHRGR